MQRAQSTQLARGEDVESALARLGLDPPRPVLVLVGGAAGLEGDASERLRPLFQEALAPFAEETGAVVIDGGTNSGVMRLMGEARGSFPLLGVVVERFARGEDGAELDPNHTHFLLVEGERWGDESPLIAAAAEALAAGAPQATVVVEGGEIARSDAAESVAAGRPVVTVRGSGRTADALDTGELVSGVPAEPAQLLAKLRSVFDDQR
jgi:hypothetical protein